MPKRLLPNRRVARAQCVSRRGQFNVSYGVVLNLLLTYNGLIFSTSDFFVLDKARAFGCIIPKVLDTFGVIHLPTSILTTSIISYS